MTPWKTIENTSSNIGENYSLTYMGYSDNNSVTYNNLNTNNYYSIVLKSDTVLLKGNGTINNPYVVKY